MKQKSNVHPLMNPVGQRMLQFQEYLGATYGYRSLTDADKEAIRQSVQYPASKQVPFDDLYASMLRPDHLRPMQAIGSYAPDGTEDLSKLAICDLYGIPIATPTQQERRMVIGDYGAFLELHPKDMIPTHLCIQPGQEYRSTDPAYASHVKYEWYTTKPVTQTPCKIYVQKRTVTYADYRPGYCYISPYECIYFQASTP